MGIRASLVVACALAAASVAHAQPQVSEASKQKANEYVKQAISRSEAGDHAAAIDLYLNAYELVPEPVLLSNIGTEYQRWKKPSEAHHYFCKYLEAAPTGANARYARSQAKKLASELDMPNTEDDACKAPTKHTVVEPDDKSQRVERSERPERSEQPERSERTERRQPREQPRDEPEPDQPRRTRRADRDDRDREGEDHTLQYAGIGVGAAGAIVFGVGVYYMIKGKSLSDQISNHPHGDPWPPTIDGVPLNQVDTVGRSYNSKAIGFSVGGGIAMIAGAVMYWKGQPSSSSHETARVTPMASPTSFGIAISGGF
jgi:hypothetical protein